ncbi:hypothetical protein D3C86_1514550 [compost metagenome]
MRQPVHRLRAEQFPDVGENPRHRMENQVLPDQCAHRGHDEKRRDQQHPHDAATEKLTGLKQSTDQHTEHHTDQQHAAHQQQRVAGAGQEARVGEEVGEVFQADELVLAGVEQVVANRREVDGHTQRYDHPQQQQGHRRADQKPAGIGHATLALWLGNVHVSFCS